jgi:hypothetical protein
MPCDCSEATQSMRTAAEIEAGGATGDGDLPPAA